MPDLLLELFSEEIPARMQAKAEADLGEALASALKAAGLSWKALITASGPRRLSVAIEGLDARSKDVREERKGPKVGAPEAAIAGFLKGAGLKDIAQAQVTQDAKKGDFYVALIETPGRAAEAIIAEAVPAVVRGFHWPKSMRWADGELRWVRPLQKIVCVLGGKIVPFEIDGLKSGNITEGHRVHGRGPYTIGSWTDYQAQLEGKGHVRVKRDARRAIILGGMEAACAKAGLEWIEDQGLLEEVTGLAEWPIVILGKMDPAFLDLPPEVIRLSMRTHQKYFAVKDRKTGKLAPHFLTVANIEASDGGVKIAEGNARVLSARLSDARFFWEKDKAAALGDWGAKLKTIAFKEELGSIGDKVERVAALARELAPKVGADPDLAEKAARLAKVDLVSEMVGEFPELQGVMGRYYALAAGENAAAADAIRDHYKPQGPNDSVPKEPVAIAVSLADKLDTLVGFWAIDEKPTGSKDPFGLRRAALGVVRIVLENSVRLQLQFEIIGGLGKHLLRFDSRKLLDSVSKLNSAERDLGVSGIKVRALKQIAAKEKFDNDSSQIFEKAVSIAGDLLSFFADRLKQYLRDSGQRHDLIDAVFELGEDDLVLIVKRVEALGAFLDTEDGKTLLAGYTRAVNILKAEDKKGALPKELKTDAALIAKGPPEEQALARALASVSKAIDAPLAKEDFAGAMTELSKLRAPVDAFFDKVMVNAEDAAVRVNRLALMREIETVMHRVAVFAKIAG